MLDLKRATRDFGSLCFFGEFMKFSYASKMIRMCYFLWRAPKFFKIPPQWLEIGEYNNKYNCVLSYYNLNIFSKYILFIFVIIAWVLGLNGSLYLSLKFDPLLQLAAIRLVVKENIK